MPYRPAAQRLCCTHRQNAGSWLVDTWNSPVSSHGFCCRLIGRYSTAGYSREFWDERCMWWLLSLCSWSSLWINENRLRLRKHCHGALFILSILCDFLPLLCDILQGRIFTCESSYCFQHILAIAILSVHHTGGSVKNGVNRITKSLLSDACKTLVSWTVKLSHKFERGHPERGY